ncbi:ABC transporter substrate-binding protein [Leifsonia sp. 2TAF2]|uniref:ABC transporter substrate-binding protein n=1 Tax=Leifsonia sp. 2TAF2 TaxID=3233009 RepID=UPI003F943A4F
MKTTRTRRFWRALVMSVALAVGATGALAACSSTPTKGTSQTLRIAAIGNASFVRNFNPFSPTALGMTTHAVYESMIVTNLAKGNVVPWLAKSYEWSSDGLSLTFNLQPDATWSDGQKLTADDVVYTFGLARKVLGPTTFDYVSDVKAKDDSTVVFTLNRKYTPGLYELGQQVIVPKHIWESQKNPSTWQNPNPVASGPFTQVSNFSAQSFDLLRNPHYWQKDKAKYAGIRLIAYSGNDAANIAGINGQLDWGLGYIQDVQKTYVDKDPKYRGYWFPPVGSTIALTLNTTVAPFNDVNVRKAISMAIDRNEVVKTGMSGYAHPANCNGLSDAYKSWLDPQVAGDCTWTKEDVAAANKLLDDSGYPKGSGGIRTDKSGKPISFTIGVGSASTDWISVAQVISRNLKQIGVDAKLNVKDWSQINTALFGGTFTGNIAWSQAGVTPFEYYRSAMSCQTVKPVGEQTSQNFQRYCSKEADDLLNQFAAATSESDQHAIMNKLQALYNELAPTVPLFPGPDWGIYNSKNFTGWPSEKNPYATLSPGESSTVLVLTNLKPRG